jgi:hypothetical protein
MALARTPTRIDEDVMDCPSPTLIPNAAQIAPGPLLRFLVADHVRLDQLLRRSIAPTGALDRTHFAEFQRGLLQHIAMEEKILFPAAARARGGQPLPIAARLRLDHGALAALLVPTPTARIVAAISSILERHNRLEEGPDGIYTACDLLLGEEAWRLLAQLRSAAEVRVSAHADRPLVFAAARRALARAGYEFDIAPEDAAR